MKKIKIRFLRGTRIVHVPFQTPLGAYDALQEQLDKYNWPKTTKGIRGRLEFYIELGNKGDASYKMAELSFEK